ncbi:DUF6603 domain-containing protein [Ruegeria meonggei]|uniref:DUF6603 domain-containing protein n=1 Tax=Ruegeria meonggei TaxID=1446476 RepID=UPI00366AF0FE
MNAFSPDDFGDLTPLLRALGLVTAEGDFNGDWLTDPQDYLSTILADDAQRQALLEFAAAVREGGIESDPDGRQWIELFSDQVEPGIDAGFYLVIDDRPAGQVNIFLGVVVNTGGGFADSRSSLLFPLFRAAKSSGPAPANPFLAGEPGGVIALSSEITVAAPPAPGEAGLARIGLRVAIPTDPADGAPDVSLSLGGLQLPGETTPRDMMLSLGNPDALRELAIELILALIEAQLRGAGGAQVRALADALGLGTAPEIPAFPVADLLSRGADALSDWVAQLLGAPAARTRWLQALADILGAGATVDATGIDLPVGGATIRIGLRAEDGPEARPDIRISLGFSTTTGITQAGVSADILHLSLATGAATAVPKLETSLHFDLSGEAMPNVSVAELILGLALDEERRPAVVIAARDVTVAQSNHPWLDLTNPDAVAAAAAQTVTDLLDELLSNLGPGAALIGVVLGWRAPAGAGAGYPTLDPVTFLGDPLGQLRAHWLDVLENHSGDVTAVLGSLRTLLAGAADVSGAGTEVDPWRLSITPGAHVAIWRDANGALAIGVGWLSRVDDLGQRCTVIEFRGRVALVKVDLSTGATAFIPEVEAGFNGRARGGLRLRTSGTGLTLETDRLGLVARWRPADGVSVEFDTPNPTVSLDGIGLPLELPDFSSGMDVDQLSGAQWDGIERLLGLLAERSGNDFLVDLVDMLGWRRAAPVLGGPDPHRLSLSALIDAPEAALRDWLGRLLADPFAEVTKRLQVFTARLGAGTSGVEGTGTLSDPWCLLLPGADSSPGIAAWRLPDRSEAEPDRFSSLPLRTWRPGDPGLQPDELARGMASELPTLLSGLGAAELAVGLLALETGWTGTDGLVSPAVNQPGTVLHVVGDTDATSLIESSDVTPFLGAAPDVLFVICTLSETAPVPEGVDPARLLDLRIRDREATAFSQVPGDASGTWTILLAPRPDTEEDDASGQAARLSHALAQAGGIAGAAVLADRAAGHGAWLALNTLPSGPNQLLIAGLATAALDPLDLETTETLHRLNELLPPVDPGEPDDADLARGRRLIRDRLSGRPLDELAPPAGWTGARRGDLQIHLLYGVLEQDSVRRAMTAVAAAGLSTFAVARANVLRQTQVEGMGIGLHVPLGDAPAAGAIGYQGRALVELLSARLNRDGASGPQPEFRPAGKVVLSGHLSRGSGWLVGGPMDHGDAPLGLRSISFSGCVGVDGTSESGTDGLEVILHGARLFGESHARLVVTADTLSKPGIPRIAPTAPAVRALFGEIVAEAVALPTPGLTELIALLRATGILGADDGFDALSLSHWVDEPTAQLQVALADPALGGALMDVVQTLFDGAGAGLSFDADQGQLSVTLEGSAPDFAFGAWSLNAVLGQHGLVSGAVNFGAEGTPGLQLGLAPFTAEITLPGDLPDIPSAIPLWPAPNPTALVRALPPTLAALALSQVLDGLRQIDPIVTGIVDAGLAGFGLTPDPVRVPPLLFVDPGAWFASASVLGGPGGGLHAPRVIAIMDALRPLVGTGGGSGIWEFAPGFALRARDDGGLVLDFALDPGAFLPAGSIALGGAFGLRFPIAAGPSRPEISLFAGVPGAVGDRQAAHLTLTGSDLRVFLRPDAGPDIEIYPGPPNLTDLLATAVTAALPQVLDAIVDTGSPFGALLGDVGNALALRSGGAFDGPALVAWAADPVASLAARWPALVSSGLGALNPVLPTGLSVANTGTGLRVSVANAGTPGSTLEIELFTATQEVEFTADLVGIPFVGDIETSLSVDDGGLNRLTAMIGPAQIPVADGVILRPFTEIDVGRGAPPSTLSTGLAFDASADQAFRLRYNFTSQTFSPSVGGDTPEEIAAGLMHLAIELLGGFVLGLDEVSALLDRDIGSDTMRDVLTDVILTPGGGLDAEFFRALPRVGETQQDLVQSKLVRLLTLIENIADAGPGITVDNAVEIGLANLGGSVGLSVTIIDRFEVIGGDIAIWLENDSRWIVGDVNPGLEIGLLNISGAAPDFAPALSVNGIGLRIGSSNAPLIKSPLSLGSIAIHAFAQVGSGPLRGGAQVELAEIGAAVSGGSSDNAVASGLLSETNDGNAALAPAFSPALSVQTLNSGDLRFGFRAGEGSGPWWLPIRKGFGPLYVDQIGLGAQSDEDAGLQSVSLLFDGSVTIAGLAASVDDLELIYRTDQGGIFDSASWGADLAGLGVSADLSGISLAGGLRKFGDEDDIEYVGMLAARFAVYGLSIYGGYASASDDQGRYTSFFAVGSFLGPIGGAPAFFLTGIGGGFGINRDLVPPTDLSDFGDFVLIQALDPAADLPTDVIAYLEEVRRTFPVIRGKFWFAAGISFTSFALVDGIAVVAVEFGSGFELSIFGLARMALPRPGFALVSIELGLLARFSTEEGVIWIQAQLTDNSWLLHESARLTGGFAYVSWFKGPNKGQFVLTLGGYHPEFEASGYPVVPRLGYNWSVSSNIVIKAENYFALTSEAVMGGGAFEATAKFGPVFVSLGWGVNAIVYFDPFKYLANAYVRISAGIRIKTWFGTIKLSFSLSAEIEVAGPEFHGKARVKVGPIDVTVKFGKQDNPEPEYVTWVDFAAKYLELASGNRAEALSGITGRGTLPAASGNGDASDTADGSLSKPFDVMSEFELSITSTIPLTVIDRPGQNLFERDPSGALGVAPSNLVVSEVTLELSLLKIDPGSDEERLDDVDKIKLRTRDTGAFPVGVWGPPQGLDDKKVPKGTIIEATEGVDLSFGPEFFGRRPNPETGGVAFNQVEAGPRRPLPLRDNGFFFGSIVGLAATHLTLLNSIAEDRNIALAAEFQTAERRPTGATGARAWRQARRTPMRVGLLTERIVTDAPRGSKDERVREVRPRRDIQFGQPRLRGQLSLPSVVAAEAEGVLTPRATRVPPELARGLSRIEPPSLDAVLAARGVRAPAFLLRTATAPAQVGKTIAAEGRVPRTKAAGLDASASAERSTGATRNHLAGIAAMAGARGPRGTKSADKTSGLAAGEVVVFDLPGAMRSRRFESAGRLTLSGAARVLAIGLTGRVLLDNAGSKRSLDLPAGTAAYAVISGDNGKTSAEIAGWTDAQSVAYLGRSMALCRGAILRAEGASRVRGGRAGGTGWLRAAHMTDQATLVETQFDRAASAVAVLFDGRLTEQELSALAISFQGAEIVEKRPMLVPYDGKTLVVYTIKSKAGFVVRLSGLTSGRLDGVMAANMTAERFVSRLVNESVSLSVGVVRTGKAPLKIGWRPPADVTPRTAELENGEP